MSRDIDIFGLKTAGGSSSAFPVSINVDDQVLVSIDETVTATISGSISSAVAVGPTVADTPDDGNPPLQIGGVARQANPTAVAANDIVKATFDDLGRQVTRPYQVRDLISTAYASLASGTKTQLIAGVASAFLDLIQITCYNNSDAATVVTLTDESTTVLTIPAPAANVVTYNFQVPKKQSATGVAWYVDLPDITGTTVEVNADFIQEV